MLGTDKAWLWAQAQHSESKEGTSEQLVSVRVVDDKPWASHACHCLLPWAPQWDGAAVLLSFVQGNRGPKRQNSFLKVTKLESGTTGMGSKTCLTPEYTLHLWLLWAHLKSLHLSHVRVGGKVYVLRIVKTRECVYRENRRRREEGAWLGGKSLKQSRRMGAGHSYSFQSRYPLPRH